MRMQHESAIPLRGRIRLAANIMWALVVLALAVLFLLGAVIKFQEQQRGVYGFQMDTYTGRLVVSPSGGFRNTVPLRGDERLVAINGTTLAANATTADALSLLKPQDNSIVLTVEGADGVPRRVTLARVPRFPNGLGIPSDMVSLYFIVLDTLLVASYFALGFVLFVRKADDGLALLVSLGLILLAMRVTTELYDALRFTGASSELLGNLLLYVGVAVLPLLFSLFPNGRFVPSWTRYYAVSGLVYALVVVLLPTEPNEANPYTWRWLTDILFLVVGVVAQVQRYRHVSTPLEKQQTKWVIFGSVIGVITYYGYLLSLLYILRDAPTREFITAYEIPGQLLATLGVMTVSLAFAFSILRYRLWDIDVIIRRTLTYALVTGALLVVFSLSVILLQRVFASLTGVTQNELVTVLSTLAIAALFVPLRNRIQYEIDKRFNRRKYNAQQVLTDFAKTVRDETDLDQLATRLMQVVNETMQPTNVSVWLKREDR